MQSLRRYLGFCFPDKRNCEVCTRADGNLIQKRSCVAKPVGGNYHVCSKYARELARGEGHWKIAASLTQSSAGHGEWDLRSAAKSNGVVVIAVRPITAHSLGTSRDKTTLLQR